MPYVLLANEKSAGVTLWVSSHEARDFTALTNLIPWAEEIKMIYFSNEELFLKNDLNMSILEAEVMFGDAHEGEIAEIDGEPYHVGIYSLENNVALPCLDSILQRHDNDEISLMYACHTALRKIQARSGPKISLDIEGSKILISAAT